MFDRVLNTFLPCEERRDTWGMLGSRKVIDQSSLKLSTRSDHFTFPSFFPNGKVGYTSVFLNIEARDPETIEFTKVNPRSNWNV